MAEVQFTEWTGDGRLRHPSFQGLREDKKARDVVRERRRPRRKARRPRRARRGRSKEGETLARKSGAGKPRRQGGVGRRREADQRRPRGLRRAEGDQARPRALLRARRRPHPSPHRGPAAHPRARPRGRVEADLLHEAHRVWAPQGPAAGEDPGEDQGRRVPGGGRPAPASISLVQMGILEIHTWNSTAAALEKPDRVVFDLDPDPAVAWSAVADAARLLKARLEDLGLASFLKTTGGKGLHVVVPLRPGSPLGRGLRLHPRHLGADRARAPAPVHHRDPQGRAQGEDPHRLPPQQPRQHRGGAVLHARAGRTRRSRCPIALGRADGVAAPGPVHARQHRRAAEEPEEGPVGGLLHRSASG